MAKSIAKKMVRDMAADGQFTSKRPEVQRFFGTSENLTKVAAAFNEMTPAEQKRFIASLKDRVRADQHEVVATQLRVLPAFFEDSTKA